MKPRHMVNQDTRDIDGQSFSSQIISLLSKEPASWAQSVIMCLPIFGYAAAYFIKYYKYNQFGISSELISVRFEDILLPFVVVFISTWSYLFNWVQEILLQHDHQEALIKFVESALGLFVFIQLSHIVSITRKCSVWQVSALVTIILQVFLLAMILIIINGCCRFRDTPRNSRFVYAGLLTIILLGLCIGQSAYLSYNLGKYQICIPDNALIVGYDSQGRAIEKSIVDERNNGICVLSTGYHISDITDKPLELRKYTYLVVE